MTLTAKKAARYLVGAVLLVLGLGILGVEAWHQYTLTAITAGVALGLAAVGGLLIDPADTKATVSTVIGWVREAVKGKDAP